MTPSEKKLAMLVAGVIVFWFATHGLTKYRDALAQNQAEQSAGQQKLRLARNAIARGQLAEKEHRTWQAQSLPTDPDVAQSLYHDWLRQQISEAGLEVKELSSKQSTMAQSKYYKQLTFTIEAEGKVDALTKFLYSFYQSGHLHRISKATLTPTDGREKLALFLIVDAISLPDCDRSDRLTDAASSLKLPSQDELEEKIVSRNIFAVYQPTQDETVAAAESDSEAAQAFVSSMTEGLEGWRMSILMRESGKILYFSEGDEIAVGQFKGTIHKLDGRKVIVSTDTERLQIRLGENLKQARPLEDSAS